MPSSVLSKPDLALGTACTEPVLIIIVPWACPLRLRTPADPSTALSANEQEQVSPRSPLTTSHAPETKVPVLQQQRELRPSDVPLLCSMVCFSSKCCIYPVIISQLRLPHLERSAMCSSQLCLVAAGCAGKGSTLVRGEHRQRAGARTPELDLRPSAMSAHD